MAKGRKNLQVGGSRKTAVNVGKTIFVAAMFLFYMFPFVMVILNSFKRKINIVKNPLMLIDDKGLQFINYVKAFTEMDFGTAFFNSILVTGVSVVLIILCSSMTAYLFVRTDWMICKVFFALMVAYMVVPFQVIMIPLVSIYGNIFGILNSRATLIFMNLGFGTGMAIFMCHGFIKTNVPLALEEAAKIDGCSRFQIFFKIVFPLMKPIISTITILNVLGLWNDYLLPNLVLGKKALYTLPLAIRTFYGTFSNDLGKIMAALVMIVAPIILVYIFLQKYIIGGVVAGAVKS
ncbi:sugar ABC transporter permease [Clostridium sp. chh4-2]|uniref:carbohydrate ABC transporter permease n=1 Tax=Clostridium sp. chh4-2 TaxID=2067550 RepID=UPI000CCF4AAD|nr:carbohydrate ABC transporter permease [Clostridium sp. chh4-2]PNV59475.1 sugar ABC transporter permease [Clostridium sp. chh4-2]